MRIATLGLALLVGLGLAVPAAADHDRRDRKRHKHVERCDDTSLQHVAAHPAQRRARILEQAERLERQTARLLKRAERRAHHPDRSERKALRKLRRLHVESVQFRDAVEHRRRLIATVPDFRELRRAYVGASKNWKRLHPNRKQRRQLRNVAFTLADLSGEFEPVLARHDRRHRDRGWDVAWR